MFLIWKSKYYCSDWTCLGRNCTSSDAGPKQEGFINGFGKISFLQLKICPVHTVKIPQSITEGAHHIPELLYLQRALIRICIICSRTGFLQQCTRRESHKTFKHILVSVNTRIVVILLLYNNILFQLSRFLWFWCRRSGTRPSSLPPFSPCRDQTFTSAA